MTTTRIAGLFYLVTFAAGTVGLVVPAGPIAAAAGTIAAVSYIAVTVLLYVVFKPVDRTVSMMAAIVSLGGIAAGFARQGGPFSTLVFFGVYCLMLAYLLFRSTSAPRALAPLMAFAGLGWLTFASPALANTLYPYNFAPGIIGEGALTIWLLSVQPSRTGVDNITGRPQGFSP